MMIYAVVSYPACLVGDRYEFMLGISRERADIIYETLAAEHYFKSVEILQSSEDFESLYGFDVFWDDGRGIAADAGRRLSAQPLDRLCLFLVSLKLTILINKPSIHKSLIRFTTFFVYNLHTLSQVTYSHGSLSYRGESQCGNNIAAHQGSNSNQQVSDKYKTYNLLKHLDDPVSVHYSLPKYDSALPIRRWLADGVVHTQYKIDPSKSEGGGPPACRTCMYSPNSRFSG
jgi:hypothetical protein